MKVFANFRWLSCFVAGRTGLKFWSAHGSYMKVSVNGGCLSWFVVGRTGSKSWSAHGSSSIKTYDLLLQVGLPWPPHM